MEKSQRPKTIITNSIFFIPSSAKNRQTYLSINVLIIIFIMLSTFSCGKVEKTAEEETFEMGEGVTSMLPDEDGNVPYEGGSRFRMHMQSLDDVDDALADSIDRQNWSEISKYAMELKNTSPVIFTGKRKDEIPMEFVMLDTMFHLQALAVAEASQSREMVRLNIEYEKLQQTCDNCHEKYKKKEH